MCGGTRGGWHHNDLCEGLSPRVRGNPRRKRRLLALERSIPACAGEPTSASPPLFRRGLSPRVRGNHNRQLAKATKNRSIPACAGEPQPSGRSPRCTRVYPRVCGGTLRIGCVEFRDRGLSPRVRGNHPRAGGHRPRAGSIPACAGEPKRGRGCRRRRWVYPRVCGGTASRILRRPELGGLSPRVRGNPATALTTSPLPRSIPACAGEPSTIRSW